MASQMTTRTRTVFAFSILLLLMLNFPLNTIASSSSANTSISATIGQFQFALYGFTSPNARVTIEGQGIKDQTYSNEFGFYEFHNKFSPTSPREACLTSQDQLGRLSQPTCLAPFPNNYNVVIGPVLLPPTVSFNKPTYFVKDKVVVSGQTIPNTTVKLSLFESDGPLLQIFKKRSYKFPEVEAATDSEGNFSVVLPSNKANSYRVFTQGEMNSSNTPKSVTLAFEINSIWMIIIQFLTFLWNILSHRLIEFIILLQLIILALMAIRHFFHPHRIRALMVRERHDLTVFHEKESHITVRKKK